MDPYSEWKQIDEALSVAGPLADCMGWLHEFNVRCEAQQALRMKRAEIQRLMPQKVSAGNHGSSRSSGPVLRSAGPTIGAAPSPTIGPATPRGVLVAVWFSQSKLPDPGGNTYYKFEFVYVVGAYYSPQMGIYAYEQMPKMMAPPTSGWEYTTSYLFLTP